MSNARWQELFELTAGACEELFLALSTSRQYRDGLNEHALADLDDLLATLEGELHALMYTPEKDESRHLVLVNMEKDERRHLVLVDPKKSERRFFVPIKMVRTQEDGNEIVIAYRKALEAFDASDNIQEGVSLESHVILRFWLEKFRLAVYQMDNPELVETQNAITLAGHALALAQVSIEGA